MPAGSRFGMLATSVLGRPAGLETRITRSATSHGGSKAVYDIGMEPNPYESPQSADRRRFLFRWERLWLFGAVLALGCLFAFMVMVTFSFKPTPIQAIALWVTAWTLLVGFLTGLLLIVVSFIGQLLRR